MKLSGNDGNFPDDAGISIELDEGINMAWSQFEHSQDVDVRILRRDSQPVDVNVTIRPTALTFDTQHVASSLVIRVSANQNGYRFSVEFADDLFTYQSSGNAIQPRALVRLQGSSHATHWLSRQCLSPW